MTFRSIHKFISLVFFFFFVACSGLLFAQTADPDRDEHTPYKVPPLPVNPRTLHHPDQEFARLSAKIQDGTASEVERRTWYELRKRYYPFTTRVLPPGNWREKALAQGKKLETTRNVEQSGFTPPPMTSISGWTHLGPSNYCAGDPPAGGCPDKGTGRGTAIWVNPSNKNQILAGFADGGVWKTTDQGTTWTSLFDFQSSISIGSITAVLGVSGVLDNTTTIYVATGEGNFGGDGVEGAGVFKSTDGGATWAQQSIPFISGQSPDRTSIRRIAVDPTNSSKLWIAADSGMFRTTDAGATWTLVTALPYFQKNTGDCWFIYWTDVVLDDSAVPLAIYAAGPRPFDAGCSTSARQDTGVYRSTDDGATWINISQTAAACPASRGYSCAGSGFAAQPGNVGRLTLINSTSDKKHLYALVHNTSTDGSLGIWETTNARAATVTWTARSTTNYCSAQCWYDMAGAVDPTNAARVLVGGLDAYVSGNNASTLNKTSSWTGWGTANYVHADHHHIWWADATTVYDVCDGGFYVGNVTGTGVNGVTWTGKNGGSLDTLQFYGMGQHPSTANLIHGGLQDNGEATSQVDGSGNITGWTQAAGGDGGFSATSQANGNNTFEEYVYAIMSMSTNAGASYGSCFRKFGGCTTALNMCSASGTSACVPDNATEFIAPMVLDSSDQTVLYTGSKFVYRNKPAGSTTWLKYSVDLSAGSTAGDDIINVHSAKNNGVKGILWASTSNGKVWMTTGADPATTTVPTWTDRSAGLPGRVVTWITTDPTNGNKAIVVLSGFNGGHVYRTTDGGANWTDISGALPNEPFESAVINPTDPTQGFVGSDFGVYANDDIWNSTTWTKINNGQLPNVRINQLEFSNANGKLRAATHGRGFWETGVTSGCTPPGQPSITSITDNASCSQNGIHVNYTGGSGATSHALLKDGVSVVPSYTSGSLYNPGDTASHSYTIRAIQGTCTTDSSASAFTDANNTPTPVISGASSNSCPGTTVGLSTTAGKTNYQWYLNGNPIGSATTSSYTVTASGNYTVSYTDNGCTGTSATKTVTIASCTPNIVFDSFTNLTQSCGDGDSVVEPGETWNVTVLLRNTGGVSATNTVANLAVNGSSTVAATITGNAGAYGTITSGSTGQATYSFTVNSGATCVNNLIFDVTSISSTEGGYPNQTSAFSVAVGSTATEQATQQTTPLNPSNTAGQSNFTPAFTLASASIATVSYNIGYANSSGSETANQLSPISGKNAIFTSALSPAFTTSGGAATSANVTWTLTGSTPLTTCVAIRLRAPDATESTLKAFGAANTGSANVLAFYQTKGPGQYTIVMEEAGGSCGASGTASLSNTQMIVQGTASSGTLTNNVKVELLDPSSTITVLKAFGAADANPYTVTAAYTGAGTYKIRVTENAGGVVTITSGQMTVTLNQCDASNCAPALPGEVTGESWSGAKDTLSWNAEAVSTSYRVYRGDPSQLAALLNSSVDACKLWEGATITTSNVVTQTPPAGSFWWYLVVGVNGTGEGSAGNATSGPRMINSSGTCP